MPKPDRSHESIAVPGRRRRALVLAAAAVGFLVVGYLVLSKTGLLEALSEKQGLQDRVVAMGVWGPLTVIGLMTAAIVFSPAPSAPIALAAGAAYGHFWGTLYILVGAQAGAMIAFGIARLLGGEAVAGWLGRRPELARLGSQNTLMAVVFVSRLIPFISFDVVSYAAGLTPLSIWRFALATFAGIVPASFALAHFGDEMASGEAGRIALSVLLLGSLTLLPLAARLWKQWRRGSSRHG